MTCINSVPYTPTYSAISSSRSLVYPHSFPISPNPYIASKFPRMALTLGECGRVVLMVLVRLLLLVSPPRQWSPPSTCLRSSEGRCTTDPNRPVRFQSIPIFFTMSKVWLLAESVLNDPPPRRAICRRIRSMTPDSRNTSSTPSFAPPRSTKS